MNKVMIGCGVLLALGVVVVIALIAFAPSLARWAKSQALDAAGGQLVGSIAFQDIQVVPDPPAADEEVSLKVGVTFAGTGSVPSEGLQLQVATEKKGEAGKRAGTATLSRTAGAGASGVAQGTVTIALGKLPAGKYTYIVALQQPTQGLVGAVEPPREVQVVVGPKKGP